MFDRGENMPKGNLQPLRFFLIGGWSWQASGLTRCKKLK